VDCLASGRLYPGSTAAPDAIGTPPRLVNNLRWEADVLATHERKEINAADDEQLWVAVYYESLYSCIALAQIQPYLVGISSHLGTLTGVDLQ